MHKKNGAIIFLLLLVCMPLLFTAYVAVSKIIIEHEMEEKMETENLQELVLDMAAIVWLKKGKEISIGGEPFDVKKFVCSGNKITVWGLYDLKEKALKKKLLEYQREKNKPTDNSILLLFFTSYYHAASSINIHAPVTFCAKQQWGDYEDITCKPFTHIIKPPPRLYNC